MANDTLPVVASGGKTLLMALADRCESVSGPDREIDADIWEAIGLAPQPLVPAGVARLGEWEREPRSHYNPGGQYHMADMSTWGQNKSAPTYTASLDAALTLVPDGYDWIIGRTNDGLTTHAEVGGRGDEFMRFADTAPLVLCSAALRARAALL